MVQSTISANGLNFDLLFWFMHFCGTVRLQTLNKIKVLLTKEVFVEKTCLLFTFMQLKSLI